MTDKIKFELGWEQRTKEKTAFRTRGLFIAIRGILNSAISFFAFKTIGVCKDYEIKVELKKAKATNLYKGKLTFR